MPPESSPLQQRTRRYLAIDYGERRVGIALSDELGLYAHPRPAIIGAERDELVARLAELIRDENVDEVVVGVPVPLRGGASAQTAEVREFVGQLRKALDVPVVEADERLSSHQAAAALRGRERKRTGQRDSAAAAIVLQSILDARRGQAS